MNLRTLPCFRIKCLFFLVRCLNIYLSSGPPNSFPEPLRKKYIHSPSHLSPCSLKLRISRKQTPFRSRQWLLPLRHRSLFRMTTSDELLRSGQGEGQLPEKGPLRDQEMREILDQHFALSPLVAALISDPGRFAREANRYHRGSGTLFTSPE